MQGNNLVIAILIGYLSVGCIVTFIYDKIINSIVEKRIEKGEIRYYPHEATIGIMEGLMVFGWIFFFPWELVTNFKFWRKSKWSLDYLEEEEKKKK